MPRLQDNSFTIQVQCLMLRMSNSERMKKVEVGSQINNRRNRPHGYYKCFSYLIKLKFIHQMGYDYKTHHPVLLELRQSFSSKCDQYFSKMRAVKLGRRDKHELKERIGFQPVFNPILKMFNKLEDKLVKPVILEAFESIREDAELRKKAYK